MDCGWHVRKSWRRNRYEGRKGGYHKSVKQWFDADRFVHMNIIILLLLAFWDI